MRLSRWPSAGVVACMPQSQIARHLSLWFLPSGHIHHHTRSRRLQGVAMSSDQVTRCTYWTVDRTSCNIIRFPNMRRPSGSTAANSKHAVLALHAPEIGSVADIIDTEMARQRANALAISRWRPTHAFCGSRVLVFALATTQPARWRNAGAKGARGHGAIRGLRGP